MAAQLRHRGPQSDSVRITYEDRARTGSARPGLRRDHEPPSEAAEHAAALASQAFPQTIQGALAARTALPAAATTLRLKRGTDNDQK